MAKFRKKTEESTHRLLGDIHIQKTYMSSCFHYQLINCIYHLAMVNDKEQIWKIVNQEMFQELHKSEVSLHQSNDTFRYALAVYILQAGTSIKDDVRLIQLILLIGKAMTIGLTNLLDDFDEFYDDAKSIKKVLSSLDMLPDDEYFIACLILLWVEADRNKELDVQNRSSIVAKEILSFLNQRILPEYQAVNHTDLVTTKFLGFWIIEIQLIWPNLDLLPVMSRCEEPYILFKSLLEQLNPSNSLQKRPRTRMEQVDYRLRPSDLFRQQVSPSLQSEERSMLVDKIQQYIKLHYAEDVDRDELLCCCAAAFSSVGEWKKSQEIICTLIDDEDEIVEWLTICGKELAQAGSSTDLRDFFDEINEKIRDMVISELYEDLARYGHLELAIQEYGSAEAELDTLFLLELEILYLEGIVKREESLRSHPIDILIQRCLDDVVPLTFRTRLVNICIEAGLLEKVLPILESNHELQQECSPLLCQYYLSQKDEPSARKYLNIFQNKSVLNKKDYQKLAFFYHDLQDQEQLEEIITQYIAYAKTSKDYERFEKFAEVSVVAFLTGMIKKSFTIAKVLNNNGLYGKLIHLCNEQKLYKPSQWLIKQKKGKGGGDIYLPVAYEFVQQENYEQAYNVAEIKLRQKDVSNIALYLGLNDQSYIAQEFLKARIFFGAESYDVVNRLREDFHQFLKQYPGDDTIVSEGRILSIEEEKERAMVQRQVFDTLFDIKKSNRVLEIEREALKRLRNLSEESSKAQTLFEKIQSNIRKRLSQNGIEDAIHYIYEQKEYSSLELIIYLVEHLFEEKQYSSCIFIMNHHLDTFEQEKLFKKHFTLLMKQKSYESAFFFAQHHPRAMEKVIYLIRVFEKNPPSSIRDNYLHEYVVKNPQPKQFYRQFIPKYQLYVPDLASLRASFLQANIFVKESYQFAYNFLRFLIKNNDLERFTQIVQACPELQVQYQFSNQSDSV